MGITEAQANPTVLHGHQVNQAAAEAEKSFNGWRLHDAVSAQPPNASIRINVEPHMGVCLKSGSSGYVSVVVAWLFDILIG